MKPYSMPQMELLPVLSTSLTIMSDYGGGSVGNVNKWDWNLES